MSQEAEQEVNWSEYRLHVLAPTHYPRPSQDNCDGETWPQRIQGYECGNQAERDRRQRLLRDADDISETTGFDDARERKQFIISPPSTPPLIRQQKMIVDPSRFPKTKTHTQTHTHTQARNTEVQKKAKARVSKRRAPRRPLTRSTGSARLALHHRKGHVIFRELFQSHVLTFETYLKDHVSHPLS